MGKFHFVNNPSMGLKKFMGITGVAHGKIFETKTGRVRLENGVTMLAKSVGGTIFPGEEIIVAGIDNTKLLVESLNDNENPSDGSGDLPDKINSLKNTIEINRIMEKIDDYIAHEEGDKAELEIEKLEKLTLSPEEFIQKIKARAEKFEEEDDLKNALVYYKKLMILKRNL
ncbi:NfeD family protein [bacterium]|nr:NfeD family protein [bacterium]